jgi:hypothetical protein
MCLRRLLTFIIYYHRYPDELSIKYKTCNTTLLKKHKGSKSFGAGAGARGGATLRETPRRWSLDG